MSAREAALQTLVAMDHQKAWSNGHLKKVIQEAHLDRRDAALATRLCFGVLQNRMLLDHYLQQYSTMKLTKMEKQGAQQPPAGAVPNALPHQNSRERCGERVRGPRQEAV